MARGSIRVTQHGEGGFGALHRAIQRVALERHAAGLADQLQQFRAAQALARGGAGIG